MFENNDRINTREAFFFIIAVMIEIGTLTGERMLVREVGTDAWLAFSLGYLFTLPAIFIMVKLGQRFYKHGFGEYSRIIAGRVVGWILSAALVIYWLFVSSRVLRGLSDIVRMTLLDRTPVEVIMFSFLIVAIYISWYGIEPLSRVSVLLVITVIPTIVVIFLTTFGQVKIDNLLPFLAQGPLPVLKSGLKEIGDWEEMSFFLIMIPFMNRHEKAIKVALYSSFAVWAFVLFIMVLSIGVLGADFTKLLVAPPITALETITFPGMFIERLGVIFSGLWIMLAFPTLCSLLFAMALVLSQMFDIRKHKHFIIPLAPIVYIISLIPQNTVEVDEFFRFLTPFGIVVLLFIPLLLYIIALIRGIKDS